MSKSDAHVLEQYRVSLENAQSNRVIAKEIGEFDYDKKALLAGSNLLAKALDAYKANKLEDDETNAAFQQFKALKEQIKKTYGRHRKRARVIFRKDPITLERLGLIGRMPKAHVKWQENVSKFYEVLSESKALQEKLKRMKITTEVITDTQSQLARMKKARSLYLNEIGESQAATETKDNALSEIEDWMSDFYAIAEIALEDKPQLMESLGKVVR